MKHIDMHCDTLSMLVWENRKCVDLYSAEDMSVDIERMARAGQMAQFFAVFLPPAEAFKMIGLSELSDEEYIELLREHLLKNVDRYSQYVSMAYDAEDIRVNEKKGKTSVILTMEDGRAVDGKLENLKKYYDMGFRAITLTWNNSNCFGVANSSDKKIMEEGLTDFGKEAVSYMQELGILVDVSHLSEGGFYDIADICKKPFVATHSNSRALCPHQRNLSDDQLRILGQLGGVAGINFGPEFLNKDITCKISTAADIAKHARYIANMGGVESVAIGSDFDGVKGNLEIADCSKMDILEKALKREDFTSKEIEKIFYKNVIRVLDETMQ